MEEQDLKTGHKVNDAIRTLSDDFVLDVDSGSGESILSFIHELNQPISAISNYAIGCIHYLNSDQLDKQEILNGVNNIIQQAEIVKGMLQKIREPFLNREFTGQNVDLFQIISSSVESFGESLKKLNIIVSYEGFIPCLVFVDFDQLQQVVNNIIRNSIEAMVISDSNNRSITIYLTFLKHYVECSFRDTGPGIDKKIIGHVCKPFFTTKPLGLGMGLFVSNANIARNGGTVRIKNNINGIGCTVSFALPVVIG